MSCLVLYVMADCKHHWIIEEGIEHATAKGICRQCGEERRFPTYLSRNNYQERSFLPPRIPLDKMKELGLV